MIAIQMKSSQPLQTPGIARSFDRAFWLAMLLTLAVLLPRGILISRAQSERVDDEYHLIRGIHFLQGTLTRSDLPLNDPPLGEALTVLPLWLAGCWERSASIPTALYGHRFDADTILMVIALWKSLLFVPMAAVVFIWCRRIYSSAAAWLALTILLIEPTFAAHIPLPTLDVLGVEGIVIACYLAWRYFESPSLLRLIAAAGAVGVALMLKHTAIILPGVVLAMALLWWVVFPLLDGTESSDHQDRHSDGSLGDLRNLDSRQPSPSPEIPRVAKAPFGMTVPDHSNNESSRVNPIANEQAGSSKANPRHSDGSLGDLRNLDSRQPSPSPEIPRVAKAPFGMTVPDDSSHAHIQFVPTRGAGALRIEWKQHAVWRIGALLLGAAMVPIVIWALCGFGFSRPRLPDTPQGTPVWAELHPTAAKFLRHRYPAALYIGSFLEANYHSGKGHPAFLLRARNLTGWWYYFPVVATYKVPIGLGALMLLAAGSLLVVRPRRGEWGLLLPMLAWTALMLSSRINIGFRHFLPAYIFMLMLSSRVMPAAGMWRTIAWIGVATAAAHGLLFHPDYLSYINFPRHRAWMQISDSNIDWGQGLKLARQWIDAHPDRQVFVREFGWGAPRLFNVRRRIGPKAFAIDREGALPRSGVLIISQVPLAGVYEKHDPFRALRKYEPDEVLGHSMLVYDLDRLRGNRLFRWTKPRMTTAPATSMAVPEANP